MWKTILLLKTIIKNTATKTGLDAAKTDSKKVVHKTTEATGKFIWNKIAEKVVQPRPVSRTNSRYAQEIIIPLQKREEIFENIISGIKFYNKQSCEKLEHIWQIKKQYLLKNYFIYF